MLARHARLWVRSVAHSSGCYRESLRPQNPEPRPEPAAIVLPDFSACFRGRAGARLPPAKIWKSALFRGKFSSMKDLRTSAVLPGECRADTIPRPGWSSPARCLLAKDTRLSAEKGGNDRKRPQLHTGLRENVLAARYPLSLVWGP